MCLQKSFTKHSAKVNLGTDVSTDLSRQESFSDQRHCVEHVPL